MHHRPLFALVVVFVGIVVVAFSGCTKRDVVVEPTGDEAKDAPGMPLAADGTPQCTFENGYRCPAHLNCCVAGPFSPQRRALCTMKGRDEDAPGGNVCR